MRKSLTVAAFAAACVAFPAAAQKAVTWNYSPNAQGSAGSVYTDLTHKPFAQTLEKDTGGRLKLRVHEQLVPGHKVMDAVLDGTVDMGTQIVLFRAEMALLNFVALPFIPRDKLPAIMEEARPLFQKQVSDIHGAQLLGYGYWAQQRLISKDPLTTIADLRNYKIRVHNNELLGMMKAAGANPLFLPMAESYPALQRGVVNGAVSSLEGIYGNKFHEVVKHVSNWPLGLGSYIWVANKDSFADLPKDLQQTLLKLFKEKYEPMTFTRSLEDDNRQIKILQGMGVQFHEPEPAAVKEYLKAAPGVLAEWKKRAGPHADALIAIINKHLGTSY